MAQQKNKSKKEKEEKKEETVKDVTVSAKVDKFDVNKFREPDVKKEVLDAQLKLKGSVLKLKYLYIIGLVILAIMFMTNKPTREKVVSIFEGVKKKSAKKTHQEATVIWWKNDSVYGTNPDQRKGGPFDAKILRNDDLVLRFEVYYEKNGTLQKGLFKGEKTSPERIEGTWHQNYPQDGGEWKLQQDLRNPRLFVGKYSCETGEWINFQLRIELD